MNGTDGQLRDLLAAAAAEPPHRISAEAVHRRVIRRRVAEFAAGAVSVAALAALVPVGIGALGHGHGRPNSGPAAARVFTSRQYGYAETLPASWRRRRWWGERAAETVPDGPAMGDVAAEAAVRVTVQRALGSLTARPRAVLVLRVFDDLPEAQVAQVLDCAPGTVKATLARAVDRLRADPRLAGLMDRETQ